MRYAFIQNLLSLHKKSRFVYHMALAAAAGFEDGDPRWEQAKALLTDEEREMVKEAKNARP